jgi:heptosyltransferase-2
MTYDDANIRFNLLNSRSSIMDKATEDQFADITPDVPARPWDRVNKPKRILVIRFKATGDMVVALPYIQFLKRSLPNKVKIDFLTREEVASIPRSIELFDKVYSIIGKKRSYKKQTLHTLIMLPRLLLQRYDVVIDLQNNDLSRRVRKVLNPKAWCEYDRFSPMPAGERYRLTIEAVGLGANHADNDFIFKPIPGLTELLKDNGWNGRNDLVIINPAGAFATRNWPLDNYVEFMKLWLQQYPQTQFLMMGVGNIAEKASYLKELMADRLINLVNKTSLEQSFAIIKKVKLVLSEDSGMMHMAWTLGIPTMALFGGTRSDWARPLGKHTDFVDSSDLSCGNCMLKICRYGDNHCITRYAPEFIFEKASELLNSLVPNEVV